MSVITDTLPVAVNYVNGSWKAVNGTAPRPVHNPATGEVLGRVALSSKVDVDEAVARAAVAFRSWRRTPAVERIQYLFKLKGLLDEHRDELARLITQECGKTLAESQGEMQRAIENVEVACGAPTLMQGEYSEDIAAGIDEFVIRQPLGVVAIIAPFNFPAMIPFWFMPYALACGNTCVIKPSERVPLTMRRVFELIDELDLPPGVVNLVNGDKEAVDALIDHPYVEAVSFVGSTPVAKYVYARATANGKRAQCSGGAKNPVVVMPDADLEMTTRIVADSAFGCAGQRCLAASLAVTVGDGGQFVDAIAETAVSRKVGNGLDEGVQMGPVITPESKQRIESAIGEAAGAGARLVVDGREPSIDGGDDGNFVRPTVVTDVGPGSRLASTEIFGPVLGIMSVETLEEAIGLINEGTYGNMACIFTSSGAHARKFRSAAEVGNVGVNIGVAAPMAFFPFSGWKQSFFGDLHGQGRDAIRFFTRGKVVVERWPRQWSRQF